jgi:hypothetical protein
MADKAVRYAPEFRRQMVPLARSGRTAASLSKEFGPSAMTIGTWIKQAGRDAGKGDGGLTIGLALDGSTFDDYWICYIDERGHIGLKSSLIVVVDKRSGAVRYAGSACDEG